MGIRDSLTLTWQDLDQSPLSLFTYCEEAMATKPNTNSSTARLWNANTQATYHRMMEKMQALYFDSLGLTGQYMMLIPIGISFILAYLIHKYIEKPVGVYFKSLLKK